MPKITTKEKYFKAFKSDVRKESLNNILDIRKFEIELYWKRATYFWAFIGAAFAGYTAILNSEKQNDESLFAIIILGSVFSLAWYLVNRGSKFWQQNWEKHLDVMEDDFIGPLYKTTIERAYYKKRWYILNAPSPYSVSKINILLSLFVFVLWVSILFDFVVSHPEYFRFHWPALPNYYGLVGFMGLVFSASLLLFGQTGKGKDDEFKTHIHFDLRTLSEEGGNTASANKVPQLTPKNGAADL